MTANKLLFVGTNGSVRAVDKATGEEVWTTSLPGSGYFLVTLLYENGVLFAGSHGKLFALDSRDGRVLWQNDLSGLGYEHMTLATVYQAGVVPAAYQADEDDRRRSSSSSSSNH